MHVRPSGFAKFVAKMQRNRIANAFNCTVNLVIFTGVKFFCVKTVRLELLEIYPFLVLFQSCNLVNENIGEKLNV